MDNGAGNFGDLTTLADVRAWLATGQSPFPIVDDALLTRLIKAASGYITEWLSRELVQRDWIEVQDGLGPASPRFEFAVNPVSAVLWVNVDGRMIPPAPSTHAAGYVFSPTQLVLRGYCVPRKALCVEMAYTAGYPVIPSEIAQACIELVALRYRERTRIGEVSRSLGGAETASYSQKDMSDPIKTLLQQHRRVTPITTGFLQQAPTATDTALLVGGI